MGDGGRTDPALLTPRQAVEDAGECSQQNVAPIEDGGALVEVGETEQAGGDEQRARRSNATLKKILHPAAKEELLRHGDKEEREQPCEHSARNRRKDRMEMEEAEEQPSGDSDRRVRSQRKHSDAEIM